MLAFSCGSILLQQRQRERRGLAGAGLGGAHDVAAGEHERDRLRLDRRHGRVALVGDGALQDRREADRGELERHGPCEGLGVGDTGIVIQIGTGDRAFGSAFRSSAIIAFRARHVLGPAPSHHRCSPADHALVTSGSSRLMPRRRLVESRVQCVNTLPDNRLTVRQMRRNWSCFACSRRTRSTRSARCRTRSA